MSERERSSEPTAAERSRAAAPQAASPASAHVPPALASVADVLAMQRAAGNATVSRLLARQPGGGASAGAGGLIVDDAAEAPPGGMRRSDFVADVRSALPGPAAAALQSYASADAATLEQLVRQQLPETASATSAQEYVEAISERAGGGSLLGGVAGMLQLKQREDGLLRTALGEHEAAHAAVGGPAGPSGPLATLHRWSIGRRLARQANQAGASLTNCGGSAQPAGQQPAGPVATPSTATPGTSSPQPAATGPPDTGDQRLRGATAAQLEAVADAVIAAGNAAQVVVPLPAGPQTVTAPEAQQLREDAAQRRMALFHTSRQALINPAAGAANNGGPPPATPPSAPAAPAGPGAGGVPQADLDRYAAQQRQADALRGHDAPHLTALRRITRGRPNRWYHPQPPIQDSVLAAIQLEAVGAAEADVRAGVSADTGRNAAADHAGMSRDLNWCGFFALYSYRVADIPQRLRASLFHTDNVTALFSYANTQRTPARIIRNGVAESLRTYHTQRGSERRWWGAETLRTTPPQQLDMRPGDIVLVDNAGAPGPNHIQMVRSWDPATRTLFTIDGNGGGYVVDTRDRDPANPTPPGDAREARVEGSTGMRLTAGPGGGHVGVGMHDLGDQPADADIEAAYRQDLADPALQADLAQRTAEWEAGGRQGARPTTKTPRTDRARRRPGGIKSRVYGIGRFSIVDFEEHDYTMAEVGTAATPTR